MKNIFEEALSLQQFLESCHFRFAFIGGLAVQRWGDPRVTNDIDLTLLTGFGDEESFIDTILAKYIGRVEDTKQTALTARVLLVKTNSNIGIDIALGGMPFEEKSIARSSNFEFIDGITLRTCSAEDLIVHKAFAGRAKDWMDIEGVIIRQHSLDWSYIDCELKPLLSLKEAPENWDTLQAIYKKIHA